MCTTMKGRRGGEVHVSLALVRRDCHFVATNSVWLQNVITLSLFQTSAAPHVLSLSHQWWMFQRRLHVNIKERHITMVIDGIEMMIHVSPAPVKMEKYSVHLKVAL